MLVRTTLVVGVAVLTMTFSTAPASPPLDRHMGKTAQQWHRIAVQRRVAGDWLQKRLGARTREVFALRRTIRRTSANDTVLTSTLERNFLCIHSHEGSWTDPGSPFYGGLQMDDDFQKTWGPEFYRAWGSADHWPASVQIAVAIRAYLTRGYHPWPLTAGYCGLL